MPSCLDQTATYDGWLMAPASHRSSDQHPAVATAADVDRLAAAAHRASRQGTPEGWRDFLGSNPHLPTGSTLVVEEGGAVAGQLSLLSLTLRLAGAAVPVRGLTALAVAPERRRSGIARALTVAALRKLRGEGVALALVYPFHAPFFGALGFGRCEWLEEIWAVPRELPASPFRNVLPLAPDRDRAALEALYAAATAEATGPFARSAWWWDRRLLGDGIEGAIYEEAGTPGGYVLYEVPHVAKSSGVTLVVKELAATTPAAFRGLLGFLEAQGDQIGKVSVVLPRGSASILMTGRGPERPLAHLPAHRKLGHFLAGAMARIVDLERALQAHPGPARAGVRGELGLAIDDPLFEEQRGDFDLSVDGGIGVRRGAAARERLTLSIDRLASILLGATTAAQLLRMGLATGSADAAALLDRALPGPEPFLWPGNAF